MAIDPKAAAAAAQAAAEAARRAAQEAAARAAAESAETEGPALADSGTREILEETEAGGAGEGQMDGTSIANVLDRDLNLLGSERESIAALPGLESAVSSASQGGVSSPFDLGSSFQSNQSPGFGKDSISTVFRVNIETDDAELVRVKQPEEEWTRWTTDPPESSGDTDTGGEAEEEWERWTTDPDDGSTGGGSGDAGGQAPNPSPLDPVVSGDPPAETEEEEEEGDDVIVVQNDSGAGGSTGVAKPAPDDSGGYTGSWSGITPIGPGSGDDDIVGGATGNTGSSGGGTVGPQGGSWAINPGDQGFVAGRQTDLRDAKEWYGGGVGQPGDPDLEVMEGNPAMLDQGIPTVDPNTSNPGSGDQANADSDAQASTAYRTMAAPAGSPAGAMSASAGDTEAASAEVADAADPMADLAPDDLGGGVEGFDDPTAAMAPTSDDDDPDRGQGRGREFGQSQGRGQGHDKDDDGDLGD